MTEPAKLEDEILEVVMGEEGAPVARGIWGDYVFEEPLPRGIETWPEDEMRAHLGRFVVPKLKFLLGKAKAGLFTPEDFARLEAAKEKREKKAEKRAAHLMVVK